MKCSLTWKGMTEIRISILAVRLGIAGLSKPQCDTSREGR